MLPPLQAAKCAELERLVAAAGGAASGPLFSTPPAAVLPFGAMEAALKEGGQEAAWKVGRTLCV